MITTTLNRKKIKFSATFMSVPNPDFGQTRAPSRPFRWRGDTLQDAAAAAHEYISANELGGGNWPKILIYDETGNEVAEISYNCRVWPPGGWKPGVEPIYDPR